MTLAFDALVIGTGQAGPSLAAPLGAAGRKIILGTGGDEAIHGILDTMYAGAPSSVLRRAVHIHPTVSELVPTMLGELTGP